MPFYFVQRREFLKSQFNQGRVLLLLWGPVFSKATNFSWASVHFTAFFPPSLELIITKNPTVSQCLTYILLKHLISGPLNILLYAKTSLVCYCQRYLEQMKRMLRPLGWVWQHPKGSQKTHKNPFAAPSNWGPTYVCTAPKSGVKIWLLHLIGMVPALQLFHHSCPWPGEALGCIKL